MKKLLMTALVVASFYSCSTEDKAIENQNAQTQTNLTVDKQDLIDGLKSSLNPNAAAKLGSTSVVFTYNDANDVGQSFASGVQKFSADGVAELASIPDATNLHAILRVGNGFGIVEEYYIADQKKGLILQHYVLNPKTGTFTPVPQSDPDPEVPAHCPDGFTELGACTNNDELAFCIGQTSSKFITAHVSQNQSFKLHVNIQPGTTYICGQD